MTDTPDAEQAPPDDYLAADGDAVPPGEGHDNQDADPINGSIS